MDKHFDNKRGFEPRNNGEINVPVQQAQVENNEAKTNFIKEAWSKKPVRIATATLGAGIATWGIYKYVVKPYVIMPIKAKIQARKAAAEANDIKPENGGEGK